MQTYHNADEAAFGALSRCIDASIKKDREWGGLIWRDGAGRYGFTPPQPGRRDHFGLSQVKVPEGTQAVGKYHTHGAYTTRARGQTMHTDAAHAQISARGLGRATPIGDFWSHDDIRIAQEAGKNVPGYRAYLGTAGRRMRIHEPATRREWVFPRPLPGG